MKKILFLLLSICALNASAQNIALNTDLVMDAAGAPSVGMEMSVAKRSTIGLNLIASPRPLWRQGHVYAVQPEYRFYFSGRPMYRHFIGLVGLYADYKTELSNRHYEGNVSGLGVSFGYVWNIAERLSIDFHSSLGAAFYHQKEWDNGASPLTEVDEDGTTYIPANGHGTVCVPLRLGISISYLIK